MKKILQTILSQPPRIIAHKCLRLVQRQWQSCFVQKLDFLRSTYTHQFLQSSAPLGTFFKKPSLESLLSDSEQILSLSDFYLNHTFDLLGSGWIQVRHGMDCRGLEGYRYSMSLVQAPDSQGTWLKRIINTSNRIRSRKIWKMISNDYVPIDWQIDFKSGYRWQEKKPAITCSPAPQPGVDIKVPWELSRMQHLPQLALAFGLASHELEGAHPPETYSNEFRNQILDFVATNPPRFGVNWHCPMDVGIRVSNWLVAYNLFKAQGASFDPDFEQAFKNSVYDHGLHIIRNLEWNPTLRSNHYLANIVSLLFVSAYLPRSPEIDTWLAFSIQELSRAMEEQFHSDGSNFEASTSYHRLSAEMMLYGTALILGLPENKQGALKQYPSITLLPGLKLQPAPLTFYPVPGTAKSSPLPPAHFERLERMADFTRAITKPNGQIVQIGDNDSGRFLKIRPAFHKAQLNEIKTLYSNLNSYQGLESITYWVEDYLDHTHLVKGINALFGKTPDSSKPLDLEAQIVSNLAGGITLSSSKDKTSTAQSSFHSLNTDSSWQKGKQYLDNLLPSQCQIYEIPVPGSSLLSGIQHFCYPDFGLYLMISQRIFLAIRCGPVGQNGNGGHAHNDALSIELQIDGIDRIADPGSFIYTPLPEIRNAYRSVKAHFAPHIDQQEPNPIDHNLFQMQDRAQAQCLYFGDKGFIGMHRGYGSPVYRLIQVENERIVIKDGIDGPEKLTLLNPLDPTRGLAFSSGYGVRLY